MRNKKNGELAVCSLEAVKKIEHVDWKRIRRLYVSREMAPRFGGLCKKLASVRGIYNVVNDDELMRLSGTRHHQGVVALIYAPDVSSLDDETIASFIKQNEVVIILDDVSNVHNVGAIVRSAAFFGLRNFIIEEANVNSVINTSAYRVAKGAMEAVNFFSVSSIENFLHSVRESFFSVASDLHATKTIFELNELRKNRALLLVLGNEENGVRELVKKNCDERIIIPSVSLSQKDKCENFSAQDIDFQTLTPQSLNVAQAATVMFYEITRS